MHGRRHTPTAKRWLILFLVTSVVVVLLPRKWTGGLISLVQVIVPFQDAVASGADAVGDAISASAASVPAEEFESLQIEKSALENQLASLSFRLKELEKDNSVLTGIRLWEVEGERIGARGRLIPARAITTDLLTWRASRLLTSGTLQGVRPGAPVVSQYFSINRGEEDGVRDGMAILLREALVGVIESAGTHTSRVRLLTDVKTQQKVTIGRITVDGFVAQDGFYLLRGRGGAAMEIRDVERRSIDDGSIAIGDLVLSAPMASSLPAAMRVGTIVETRVEPSNPLLAILTVASPIEEDSLRRVYVYDPGVE